MLRVPVRVAVTDPLQVGVAVVDPVQLGVGVEVAVRVAVAVRLAVTEFEGLLCASTPIWPQRMPNTSAATVADPLVICSQDKAAHTITLNLRREFQSLGITELCYQVQLQPLNSSLRRWDCHNGSVDSRRNKKLASNTI